MEEWMHSPWSTKMAFWCRDTLSFSLSLSILPTLPPTHSHAHRAARPATDDLKVCQLAGWEGRRERHQKEFIQRVLPITRLFTSVWRLIRVKLETLPFTFTLTDNSLHDLVNLGSVSVHSKNVNRENGRSLLLRECWQPVLSPAQQCFLATWECGLKGKSLG